MFDSFRFLNYLPVRSIMLSQDLHVLLVCRYHVLQPMRHVPHHWSVVSVLELC
jgi:hypothetical protein